MAKRLLITVSLLVLLMLSGGGIYLLSKRAEIRSMREAFRQVRLGDGADRVERLMGQEHRIIVGERMFEPSPGATRLLAGSAVTCVRQYLYSVDTVYLPISWIIGFDDSDTVVVKFQLE
jgi:hypothetical protein